MEVDVWWYGYYEVGPFFLGATMVGGGFAFGNVTRPYEGFVVYALMLIVGVLDWIAYSAWRLRHSSTSGPGEDSTRSFDAVRAAPSERDPTPEERARRSRALAAWRARFSVRNWMVALLHLEAVVGLAWVLFFH